MYTKGRQKKIPPSTHKRPIAHAEGFVAVNGMCDVNVRDPSGLRNNWPRRGQSYCANFKAPSRGRRTHLQLCCTWPVGCRQLSPLSCCAFILPAKRNLGRACVYLYAVPALTPRVGNMLAADVVWTRRRRASCVSRCSESRPLSTPYPAI